jgi:hypothetical protein
VFVRNACTTSSTWPDIQGISLIPAVVIIEASGREMAPQIRVSIPNPVSRMVLLGRKCSLISVSNRAVSLSSVMSTTTNRDAVSKTGETLPFHVGMAIFIAAFLFNTVRWLVAVVCRKKNYTIVPSSERGGDCDLGSLVKTIRTYND